MQHYIDKCDYTEDYTEDGGHTYTFTGPCVITGKEHSVTVKGPELFEYRQSGWLSSIKSIGAGDREFLISGTSPEGWELMFGETIPDLINIVPDYKKKGD